jgi:hypothetical protein
MSAAPDSKSTPKYLYIPIGIDCDVATMCKELGIREAAFPFDHIVTYEGITNIVKNDFQGFLPNAKTDDLNEPSILNKQYGVRFMHDNFLKKSDVDKYKRRIERFNNILKTEKKKVIFIKKGHSLHHHNEYNMTNEYNEIKELDDYLQNNYKELDYKIVLILLCKVCNCKYVKDDNRKNIDVYIYNDIPITDNQFQNIIITKSYYRDIFNVIIQKYR